MEVTPKPESRKDKPFGFHHYLTKYVQDEKLFIETWLQFDLFQWCYIVSRRKIQIDIKRYAKECD